MVSIAVFKLHSTYILHIHVARSLHASLFVIAQLSIQSEYVDLRRKYREVTDKYQRLQERAKQQVLVDCTHLSHMTIPTITHAGRVAMSYSIAVTV